MHQRNFDKLEHGYDYLTVYDDDNMNDNALLASLTGELIPGTVVSTGNKMLLHFTSDGIENSRGFSANYVSSKNIFIRH